MESITDINERSSLKDNKIIGNPNLINSRVEFTGKNNILFCEDNINIANSSIQFHGDNSVVYLCFTKSNYPLDIHVFQNSLIYIGRDNKFSPVIHINVQEHQNLIIGDDCIIGSNCNIRYLALSRFGALDTMPIYTGLLARDSSIILSVFRIQISSGISFLTSLILPVSPVSEMSIERMPLS